MLFSRLRAYNYSESPLNLTLKTIHCIHIEAILTGGAPGGRRLLGGWSPNRLDS